MALPLAAILSAAPGVISAATEVIRMIKQKKDDNGEAQSSSDEDRLRDVVSLIEKQAEVIEELAQANQQLALAVRNNRIITMFAVGIALLSAGIAVFL